MRREERFFWLLAFFIYGTPNILTFLISLDSQKILVDEKDIWVTLDVFGLAYCITIIILSLVFLGFYLSRCGEKYFPLRSSNDVVPRLVGVLVFVVQVLDAFALYSNDYGRVGGVSTSSSLIVILVSYLNPSAIFLIYYGHLREKKIPYLNLLVYILINVAKGWSGFWLILFFIEFYFFAKYISLRGIILSSVLAGIIGLAVYPATQAIKEDVRGTVSVEAKDFSASMSSLLNRIQFYSNVVLLSQESRSIEDNIESYRILPFYADNQIGEKMMTIIGIKLRPPSLQKYITIRYLIDSRNIPKAGVIEDFSWYTSVGFSGWFFVLGWLDIFLYLLFTLTIVAIPYWIAGKFIGSRSIIPIIHSISLVYFFNGWFSPLVSFTFGLIVYSTIVFASRCYFSLRNKRSSQLILHAP